MTKKSSNALPKEIENYLNFLNRTTGDTDKLVTKARINKHFDEFGKAINTFLVYPDIFVDLIRKEEDFNLFFFQRLLLRIMNRHRQSYHTFTRGLSKSFLAFLSRYITTMLTPRHKAFIVAGTKLQAANIAKEKVVQDLWVKFPFLGNEMIKFIRQGRLEQPFVQGKDYAEFRFTHGGVFDVIGSGSGIRGARRHSGIFEEVIDHDATEINERILPLMNKSRETARGSINPNEPHANKIFVTTAGYQGTFAYEKLVETLCFSVIDPDQYMIIGGDYRIPLMHGLLDNQTITEIISSPSFERDSFEREYGSKWSGSPVGAAFTMTSIDKMRQVINAHTYRHKIKEEEFYVISADMAKDGSANIAVVVYLVSPRSHSFFYRQVNALRIDQSNYEYVSMLLKDMIDRYDARLLVYDAMGIGASLRDWLNKEQADEQGHIYPSYGIINPPKTIEGELRRVTPDKKICYEIKATGELSNEIHRIFFSKVGTGNIKMLIKGSDAVSKFKDNKNFNEISDSNRKAKLLPYFTTDIMAEELKNLDIEDVSDNIQKGLKIKRRNPKIQKDFFSAAEYGIYAVHVYLETKYYNERRDRARNIADYIMYTPDGK